jgi:uncharacterized protein YjbJ (UPF0337 family)
MLEQAKDKAEEIIGKSQEAFGKAAGDSALNLEGKIRKHAAQACYGINDYLDSVKDKTAKDPLPALIIAAGAGFLLAKILGPRRR